VKIKFISGSRLIENHNEARYVTLVQVSLLNEHDSKC